MRIAGNMWSRAVWTVAVIGALSLSAACFDWLEGDPRVDFHFDNRTEFVLCYFPGLSESSLEMGSIEPNSQCLAEVDAQSRTTWSPECTPNNLEFSQTDVALTVKSSGEIIYHATATCQEWIDAGSTITIDREGGEFVVTDPLPGPANSPDS